MNSTPEDDEERTRIRVPATGPVTVATEMDRRQQVESASAEEDHDSLALPTGTMLGEFELTSKLGEGGFSIVYLAHDHSLDRKVALKEYLPSSIAQRKAQTQVSPRSERHRDTFDAGLKSFINEAKLLAHFDHGSLVKVYRFWSANGTAYMVMPLYHGLTLKDTVRAMPEPPDEPWLMKLLGPLTEALSVIHGDQCYHRDIAPDNVILLEGSGRPLLLDFGAARRVIGDMTQALTVILKPGYAPVEQYAELPDMKQGPWTDVYALAATVYWCITGKTPPPSVGRMLSDSYVPLAQVASSRYSARFLSAVDRALAVRPEQRTPSIEAFRVDLGLASGPGAAVGAWAPTVQSPKPAVTAESAPAPVSPPPAAPPPPAPKAPPAASVAEAPPASRRPKAGSASEVSASASRLPLWLGGGVLLTAAAGAAWWALQSPATPPPPPVSEAVPVAVPATPVATPVASPVPSPEAPAVVAAPPTAPPAAESKAPTAPPVAPPVAVAEPVAPAPVRAPSPPRAAQARPQPTSDDAPEASTRPAAPTKAAKNANAAECASILQIVSLGDASPELINRLKALNCK
jgi:hypothetical protein